MRRVNACPRQTFVFIPDVVGAVDVESGPFCEKITVCGLAVLALRLNGVFAHVSPAMYCVVAALVQGWNLTDSEIKIRRKIGDEKYLFLMQIYHYFEDVLSKAMDPDEMGGMMDPGSPSMKPMEVRALPFLLCTVATAVVSCFQWLSEAVVAVWLVVRIASFWSSPCSAPSRH